MHVKKDGFNEHDPDRTGLIHLEAFKSIYKTFVHRPELLHLFNRLSKDQRALSSEKLLDFLQNDLCEPDTDEDAVRQLIGKHELMLEARRDNYMTLEGFVRFMNSEDNYILRRKHRQVYQDMNQPLTNYYISTSHNTYLLSDQLVGQSHPFAYSSALMRGCRCLEIDCWDGEEDEPVVFHGFTLTSKLLFKTVISVINQYAFQASPYPLILSLENHCSPKQQDVMARHLLSILGDKLLTMTVANSFSRFLPSPEALKGKILIKHKKIGLLQDTILRPVPSAHGQIGELVEHDDRSQKEQLRKIGVSIKFLRRSAESKTKQVQNTAIAMMLSDLVIYTKSKKFISFKHSKENQKVYENNSLPEKKAQNLAQNSAQEFIQHTRRFITRIYPKGSRTDSSNFYPQEFWNVGCQMTALNFQTPGIPMDLQDGKFLDNGRCGYVLKPEFLRNEDCSFVPHGRKHRTRQMFFTIKVISGFLLPHGSISKTNKTSLIVKVEIYGVPVDEGRKQTQVVKNNAFNPQWNQSLTFSIQVPELALVRFSLEDHLLMVSNEFLGQYTLPLISMSKGYRHIPLLNKHGQSMAPASLFVHIWYQ
ncbi:1-phosphatidylinositol 4,5-bisphosphate phosphodiesterase zeta-1 [Bufo gargarizans]|uniref:1-phosphatidylinositol 4,5-bisphosphate phosphodiesterase zeta-1 n=1 Tax=Bufo gargarizans TaxID=30331 RepID=UPI001CF42F7E|nr:1-phosphatidylinositol 4,5-bisphosphate phosphodiesterase zeta-1 [Bufo gargarizans]